jgi:hypothetical protein
MWQIPDLCYMIRKKSRQLSHYSEKLVIAYWLISTSWYSTAHLVCVETATLTKFVAKLVEEQLL